MADSVLPNKGLSGFGKYFKPLLSNILFGSYTSCANYMHQFLLKKSVIHTLKSNLYTSSLVMRMVYMVDTSRMFKFLITESKTFHEFLKVLIKLKFLHRKCCIMALNPSSASERYLYYQTVLKDNFRNRPIILAL